MISTPSANGNYTFRKPYIHIPYVRVTLLNETTEYAYSTTQLAVDYDLSGGSLILTSGNNPVSLPPGSNTLSLQGLLGDAATEFTCNISTGDKLNRTQFSYDLVESKEISISISYKHDSLGTMTSTAHCYNSISELRTNLTLEVVNPCFRINERFDRQYSMPDTPLEASVTEDLIIFSRSVINCEEMGSLDWTVEYADIQSRGIIYTNVNFKNLADPLTNVMLIPKYSLKPGLYKITSLISVKDTWLEEYTFVKFTLPPPTAFIEGGDSVSAKGNTYTEIILNAVDVSYQQEIGDGGGLTYSWTCRRSDGVTFTQGCGGSSGKWTLLLDTYNSYDVTVTVSNQLYSTSFTQRILRVNPDIPVVSLRCLSNCGQKAVVSRRTIYRVYCKRCKGSRKNYQYSWFLEFHNSTGSNIRIEEEKLRKMTLNYGSIHKRIIIIKEGVLKINTTYTLSVTQKRVWSNCKRFFFWHWCNTRFDDPSHVSVTFETGSPPVSGTCQVVPSSGYAMTTEFRVNCTGWKAGNSDKENHHQPLLYIYKALIYQKNGKMITRFSTTLYSGYESSVGDLKLPTGPKEHLQIVKIMVDVVDHLGERSDWSQNVVVYPMHVNSTWDDGDKFDNLCQKFESLNIQEKRNRNYLSQLHLMIAVSSMFINIPPTNPFLDDLLIARYSEKVEELLGNISNIVEIIDGATNQSMLTHQMLNLITWTMHSLTRHSQYINENSIHVILGIFRRFSLRIKENFKVRPFMMKYKGIMNDSVKGMVSVLQSIFFQIHAIDDRAKRKDIDTKLWEKSRTQNCERNLEEFLQLTENTTSLKETFQGGIEEVISTLQQALLSVLVSGEGEVSVNFGQATMSVERTDLGNKTNGMENVIPTLEMEEEIVCEAMEYEGDINPHSSSDNSDVDHTKKSKCYSKYSLPIVFHVKETPKLKRINSFIDPDDDDQMIYFQLNASTKAVLIYFRPSSIDVFQRRRNSLYTVYARRNERPTSKLKHFRKKITVNDWSEELGFKVFIPKGICGEGDCFLGIKPRKVLMGKKVIVQKPSNKRKRSSSTPQNTFVKVPLPEIELDAIITAIGCAVQINDLWKDDVCNPLPVSNIREVICRCPDISASQNVVYGSSFLAVNDIDFHGTFHNFDISNAVVYGTIIAILLIYTLLLLLLRRKDTEDREKCTLGFLCDNDVDDDYFYLVTVVTGLRAGAGTQSKVNFILYGEYGDSGVRILSEDLQKGFATGSIHRFIMSTPKYLGRLINLWIWHDFSAIGLEQSWYLRNLIFDDLKTRERYVFQCNTWLALDKVNGCPDYFASATDVHDSNVLFSDQLFHNFTENSLWFSTVFRPEHSSFTRVQRLSCILAFLFLAMLANAMFYEAPGTDEEGNLKIGIISFSLTTVFTSLKSTVITTLPITLVTLIFQHTRDNATETDKEHSAKLIRQSRKPLPHWMRHIACAIIVSSIASSAFVLIMYSMQWGKTKSQEWLSSFVFSFFASPFCIDPLKLLLFAAVFSFILKTPSTNRCIEFDITLLKKYCAFHSCKKSKHYVELVGLVFHKTQPLNDSKADFMRKRHKEVASAKKSFQHLVMSLVLTGSVLVIGFNEFDVNAYYFQNNIRNYLVSDGYGQFGFSAVNNTDGFYKWMMTTFIPTFYPLTAYNGEKLDILAEQMFGDMANIRVGPGRIRQVRMPERECDSTVVSTVYPCINSYILAAEEKGTYCPRWQQWRPDCSDSGFIPEAWSYIDSSVIFGTPVSAEYNTYSGGGYFFLLDEERDQSKRQVQDAKDNNWIDRHTRAVLTEFTLYNPNTNMFINAVLVLEFLEQGFAMPYIHLRPFTRSLTFNECPTSLQTSLALFVLYFIFISVDIVAQLITNCRSVIKRAWFWVEVLFAMISACCMILFVVRKSISDKTEKMFYDQQYTGENNFINYYQIIVLNIAIQFVLGIISFFAFLKISRAFQYTKTFSVFWRVIYKSSSPLLGFSVVFGITLCAFASMIYILFGKSVYSFRNIASVFGSLANTLVGRNNVGILMNVSPVFAMFFYFTYGVTVIFLLLNIFAAILNETIDIVKMKNRSAEHVFGIGDYTRASLKNIIILISTTVSGSKEKKKDEILYGEARQDIDTYAVVYILQRLFWAYQAVIKDKQVRKDLTGINNYAILRTMPDDDDVGTVEEKTTEENMETEEDKEINTHNLLKYI
ncbi:uncharacterized protein LOC134282235 [Saccostrea cucullata]|uniref:uncharacterized protein LOC134282235 n=1 Tax=Saccostrea cuccullata TaxID=36930 RepID=UPI002ED31BE5